MIHGGVTQRLEAILPLPMFDAVGQPHLIDVIIDTAYTGFLILPAAVIRFLQLVRMGPIVVVLADGSTMATDIYQVRIDWDGTVRNVDVTAVETDPLLGMQLLNNSRITIDAIVGGAVTVEPIP